MLCIKVELWPWGIPFGHRELARAYIGRLNEAGAVGNYNVRIMKDGKPGQVWKEGQVDGFPRLDYGAWDLLLMSLLSVLPPRRIKILQNKMKRILEERENDAVERGEGEAGEALRDEVPAEKEKGTEEV